MSALETNNGEQEKNSSEKKTARENHYFNEGLLTEQDYETNKCYENEYKKLAVDGGDCGGDGDGGDTVSRRKSSDVIKKTRRVSFSDDFGLPVADYGTTGRGGSGYKTTTITFDDAMVVVGEFGPYQFLIFLVFTVGMIVEVIMVMIFVFVAAIPSTYYCREPGLDRLALSSELAYNISIPAGEKCLMYDRDYSNWTDETVDMYQRGLFNDSAEKVYCKYGWYFGREMFEETIVTQWNLVCKDEWKGPFVYSAVGFGQLIGAPLWGILIDRFGRRRPYCFAMFAMVLFSGGASFAPNYHTYCLLQFLMGINTVAAYAIGVAVAVEITGIKVRGHLSTAVNYFWSLGYTLLPLMAYFVRHWAKLQFYISCGSFVCLLLLAFIKESPRWLYTRNKKDKADAILMRIAKSNKKQFPETMNVIVPDDENGRGKMSDLCGNQTMGCITIILFIVWFSNSLVYFGISLYLPTMSESPFLNFFISGVVEFPGYVIAQLTIAYLGRKWPLCGVMLIASVCLYTLVVVSNLNITWLSITLALVGKLCVTATWSIAVCFTIELYPTVIRGRGLLMCTLFGNLANMLAPQVNLLGNLTNMAVPPVIFGSFALLSGLVCTLLPETKGRPLCDTVEEMRSSVELFSVKGIFAKKTVLDITSESSQIDGGSQP